MSWFSLTFKSMSEYLKTEWTRSKKYAKHLSCPHKRCKDCHNMSSPINITKMATNVRNIQHKVLFLCASLISLRSRFDNRKPSSLSEFSKSVKASSKILPKHETSKKLRFQTLYLCLAKASSIYSKVNVLTCPQKVKVACY